MVTRLINSPAVGETLTQTPPTLECLTPSAAYPGTFGLWGTN